MIDIYESEVNIADPDVIVRLRRRLETSRSVKPSPNCIATPPVVPSSTSQQPIIWNSNNYDDFLNEEPVASTRTVTISVVNSSQTSGAVHKQPTNIINSNFSGNSKSKIAKFT